MKSAKIKRSNLFVLVLLCILLLGCPCSVPELINEGFHNINDLIHQGLKALSQKSENPVVNSTEPPPVWNDNDSDHDEGNPGHSDFFPTLQGTPSVLVQFEKSDCACGDFTISQSFQDNGYLFCSYASAQASGGINRLEFYIQQQSTIELTKQDVAQTMASAHEKADSADPQKHLNVVRNNETGFTYVLTYTINSNTLTCGEGQGAFLASNAFKVDLDMDSCDLYDNGPDYVTAMETMEDCAQNAIANHTK